MVLGEVFIARATSRTPHVSPVLSPAWSASQISTSIARAAGSLSPGMVSILNFPTAISPRRTRFEVLTSSAGRSTIMSFNDTPVSLNETYLKRSDLPDKGGRQPGSPPAAGPAATGTVSSLLACAATRHPPRRLPHGRHAAGTATQDEGVKRVGLTYRSAGRTGAAMAAVLLSAAAVAACSGKTSTGADGTSGAASASATVGPQNSATPKAGGSFTMLEETGLTGAWPTGLDPATDGNGSANQSYLNAIYGNLFELGANGQTIDDLATG